MPLSLKWITSENVSDSLNSRYVYSSIWLITLGSYSLIPISFRMAAMTKASFGVLFAGKEPSACSLVSVLSAMMFSLILLHDSYTTIKLFMRDTAVQLQSRQNGGCISFWKKHERCNKFDIRWLWKINQVRCLLYHFLKSVILRHF